MTVLIVDDVSAIVIVIIIVRHLHLIFTETLQVATLGLDKRLACE